MRKALAQHWPEYLIEAAALGLFMISACTFGTILEHPASPVHQALPNPLLRRALMGLAMGATAAGIVFSPWGKRSGAHLNPAVTLTFLRLGKVRAWDAFFYIAAQFAGGVAGVLAAAAALRGLVAHPAVHYVVTAPGAAGEGVAFVAEAGISFLLMAVVLRVSNHPRLARYTGFFAGTLVATYITLEAPISGMSMNPARSFGSAAPAMFWHALWVYFLAPPLGMLLAGELYRWRYGIERVRCAKLHHDNDQRCIFRCGYMGA
jgi:aquaporin Z